MAVKGFCVLKIWWVQDNPHAFRTHSSVLYVEFLAFRRGIKKKKIEITI
jgi:hypothetical protein